MNRTSNRIQNTPKHNRGRRSDGALRDPLCALATASQGIQRQHPAHLNRDRLRGVRVSPVMAAAAAARMIVVVVIASKRAARLWRRPVFVAMGTAVASRSRVLLILLDGQVRISGRDEIVFFGPEKVLLGAETAAIRPALFGTGAATIVILAREGHIALFSGRGQNGETANGQQVGREHERDADSS
jgi:hypothetical protein